MESATDEKEEELRGQVYAVLADQGTEKGCADISVMRPAVGPDGRHTFDDEHARNYPNAMWMPEHIHICDNAHRTSVEGLPTH